MGDGTPIFRDQMIGVLRRNGLYWAGGTAWVEQIEKARVYPVKRPAEKARIDIGIPCEIVHILPIENPDILPQLVGEDADQKFTPERNALSRRAR